MVAGKVSRRIRGAGEPARPRNERHGAGGAFGGGRVASRRDDDAARNPQILPGAGVRPGRGGARRDRRADRAARHFPGEPDLAAAGCDRVRRSAGAQDGGGAHRVLAAGNERARDGESDFAFAAAGAYGTAASIAGASRAYRASGDRRQDLRAGPESLFEVHRRGLDGGTSARAGVAASCASRARVALSVERRRTDLYRAAAGGHAGNGCAFSSRIPFALKLATPAGVWEYDCERLLAYGALRFSRAFVRNNKFKHAGMMRIFHGNEIVIEPMTFRHNDDFGRMIISHHHVSGNIRHQIK